MLLDMLLYFWQYAPSRSLLDDMLPCLAVACHTCVSTLIVAVRAPTHARVSVPSDDIPRIILYVILYVVSWLLAKPLTSTTFCPACQSTLCTAAGASVKALAFGCASPRCNNVVICSQVTASVGGVLCGGGCQLVGGSLVMAP
jgi:hypothetical protein